MVSKEECEEWIKHIEEQAIQYKKETVDFKSNDWNPELSNLLANRVEKDLGSGRITFVKYTENSNGIARHIDLIRENNVVKTGIVYLNDVEEGHTVLYLPDNSIVRIQPRRGNVLIFDVSLPHEGLPPKGKKYILIFRIKSI